MTARLLDWWTGLARRERLAVAIAAALVAGAALYLVGIEPAWRTRTRLTAELPRLRSQAADMQALALEASKLRGRAPSLDTPAQARPALARLAAEKNLPAPTVQDAGEQRIVVALRRADAAGAIAWLKDASTELPLRISAARVARAGPGLVDVDVTLTQAAAR